MGRKSKLTPEIQDTICNWLKKGAEEDAKQEEIKALTSGDTSLPAIKEDSDIELVYIYSEFSEAVARARAEAEGAHIKNIRRAADNGTWQASAWFLERSFPKKWGKRSTLDIDAQGDEPIKFQITYGD